MSLSTYNGRWTRAEASHLLHRAGFGAGDNEVERALADGVEASVERLLTPQRETGAFERTADLLHRSALGAGNIGTLKSWWFYRLAESANPLVERMALLWHNHFATSFAKVRSVKAMADQNALFRQHALGSFAELSHAMSRDVAMLEWLDGNANRRRHPNENFARELMELFTLGVGNYSEADIQEAARAFTGWHVRRGEFWFHKAQHDPGAKTVFGHAGVQGGDEVVDLCLERNACPRFIATKLLREFLCPAPPERVVDALAAELRAGGLEIAPALRALFLSAEFYAPQHRASIIKSPAALVAGTARDLQMRTKPAECAALMARLGQDLFHPPTVKGWEGDRLWIHSASLIARANFAAEVAGGNRYGSFDRPSEGKEALQLRLSLPEYQLE